MAMDKDEWEKSKRPTLRELEEKEGWKYNYIPVMGDGSSLMSCPTCWGKVCWWDLDRGVCPTCGQRIRWGTTARDW